LDTVFDLGHEVHEQARRTEGRALIDGGLEN